MTEHELLRSEMEKMAEHMESLDHELETDDVAGILRCLLDGWTVAGIIEEYDLQPEDGV